MSVQVERTIITILLMLLISIGLNHCKIAPKGDNTKQPSNVLTHSSSIGKFLGCMFSPAECDQLKKDKKTNDLSDTPKEQEKKITDEYDTVDKDIQ